MGEKTGFPREILLISFSQDQYYPEHTLSACPTAEYLRPAQFVWGQLQPNTQPVCGLVCGSQVYVAAAQNPTHR